MKGGYDRMNDYSASGGGQHHEIDLLAILERIRIERQFATFCRIFECAQ